nr:MAG TPA: hypothetical protein [Caudoviricetes sp.]
MPITFIIVSPNFKLFQVKKKKTAEFSSFLYYTIYCERRQTDYPPSALTHFITFMT